MPSVLVELPPALRTAAGGAESVRVEADNVDQLLRTLVGRYPLLRDPLLGPNNRLRSSVLVYVDGEDIRYHERESTALAEGNKVTILRAIAGG